MEKNSTKKILILKGYPEEEAEEMAEEINEVVNQSYMKRAIGFDLFRDILIETMLK